MTTAVPMLAWFGPVALDAIPGELVLGPPGTPVSPDVVFRDAEGFWWRPVRSGDWLRFDGGMWSPGDRPMRLEGTVPSSLGLPAVVAAERDGSQPPSATSAPDALRAMVARTHDAYRKGRLLSTMAEMLLGDWVLVAADGTPWTVGVRSLTWYAFVDSAWVSRDRPSGPFRRPDEVTDAPLDLWTDLPEPLTDPWDPPTPTPGEGLIGEPPAEVLAAATVHATPPPPPPPEPGGSGPTPSGSEGAIGARLRARPLATAGTALVLLSAGFEWLYDSPFRRSWLPDSFLLPDGVENWLQDELTVGRVVVLVGLGLLAGLLVGVSRGWWRALGGVALAVPVVFAIRDPGDITELLADGGWGFWMAAIGAVLILVDGVRAPSLTGSLLEVMLEGKSTPSVPARSGQNRSMQIGIVLFDEVDVLDVGGPYEVFLTASRLAARDGDPPPFDVLTIGEGPVTAYGGMGLTPTHRPDEVGELDAVIVPGAIAIDRVVGDPSLVDIVRGLADRARITASVCTGAFVLGEIGLLAGHGWTTHFEDVAELGDRIGSRDGVLEPWVDEGAVVTSGGLSSGIAMALHLVDRLAGRDLAVRTARQLDYAWAPEPLRYGVVVMVWTGPGGRAALHDYERRIEPMAVEHGGVFDVVLAPTRATGCEGAGPDEIHVLSFPDEDAFSSFLADPRRENAVAERDRVITRAIVFEGDHLTSFG